MDILETISKAYEFTEHEKDIWRKLKKSVEHVIETGEELSMTLEQGPSKVELTLRKVQG